MSIPVQPVQNQCSLYCNALEQNPNWRKQGDHICAGGGEELSLLLCRQI